jgi:ABC-type polysaccharide/polyol phosphate transport system ATPase subunit
MGYRLQPISILSDLMGEGPPVIEVRDLRKSFRMRTTQAEKPRKLRVRAKGYRRQRVNVLDGISFDVRPGEMFGIVGRNGSGKSTLLKILSRIYGYDSGSIRMRGRVAPFVDLGVGFHPELTAWDNVRTNAVMMGLTPRQARERFDKILEFAELAEFRGLELKNYSSGMRMRLAFATLLEVEADVLLIDEIIGVGDAGFRGKCASAFTRLREEGKTIVLVSHALGEINRCDRALSLHEGKIGQIGDPEDVTKHYLELYKGLSKRRDRAERPSPRSADGPQAPAVEITDVWLEDSAGRVASRIPAGERPRIHALIEVRRMVREPTFLCEIHDEHGSLVRELETQPLGGPGRRLRSADRVHVQLPAGRDLAPGSYIAACRMLRAGKGSRRASMTEPSLLGFDVSRAGRTRPAPAPAGSALQASERRATARL